MIKHLYLFLTTLALTYGIMSNQFHVESALAQDSRFDKEVSVNEIISKYEYVQKIAAHTEPLPVPFQLAVETSKLDDYIVIDDSDNTLQPRVLITEQQQIPFDVTITNSSSSAILLSDGNLATFESFALSPSEVENNVPAVAQIIFTFDEAITTNRLSITVDTNVTMPRDISIQALNTQTNAFEYVINRRPVTPTVFIPETTSRNFIISLTYEQPLRIAEIAFGQNNLSSKNFLRFVARPNTTYSVYSITQGYLPYIPGLNLVNLSATTVQARTLESVRARNPRFVPEDTDRDGVIDSRDNCPNVSNPSQEDVNTNGSGEACEDSDFDGIMNAKDNCPDRPNPLQQDDDEDNIGDHCDGIESRWIEQFPFLPWLGIGVGFIVVLALFRGSIQQQKLKVGNESEEDESKTHEEENSTQ